MIMESSSPSFPSVNVLYYHGLFLITNKTIPTHHCYVKCVIYLQFLTLCSLSLLKERLICFYFMCMGLLPACMYLHHIHVVPLEAGRGIRFPWGWNY